MSYTLRKGERLRKRSDFQRVFRDSRQVSCRGLRLLVRGNGLDCSRCAFICSRALGNAVKRNREKRVAREIYRSRKNRLRRGFDLLFILYPGRYGFPERRDQMDLLLRDAGLIEQI